jgi:hypothetical protein
MAQNVAGRPLFHVPKALWRPFYDSEQAIYGATALTLFAYQDRANALKILLLLAKKLCPQMKFAAILNL